MENIAPENEGIRVAWPVTRASVQAIGEIASMPDRPRWFHSHPDLILRDLFMTYVPLESVERYKTLLSEMEPTAVELVALIHYYHEEIIPDAGDGGHLREATPYPHRALEDMALDLALGRTATKPGWTIMQNLQGDGFGEASEIGRLSDLVRSFKGDAAEELYRRWVALVSVGARKPE